MRLENITIIFLFFLCINREKEEEDALERTRKELAEKAEKSEAQKNRDRETERRRAQERRKREAVRINKIFLCLTRSVFLRKCAVMFG